ncbi:GNAT family N-acetyltransferase [Providencia burhodogranariea]|uniref:N-acetyltransferase GCN5 n=1 Tax=Providencia burhodogranariea DSM 19968 TaxID=1141662 RepID=K8X3L3_9GAMM|nr:GNAT family N-acetyltransferase [Providencia burhodogranariea]EKT63045.1 N-acetyltransferase GCN5 [Providencia burhodogranariea DSM 19968]
MINSSGIIPQIETERLILSGHQQSDFSALTQLWATESMVRHIGGSPSTERDSWMRMLAYIGLWPLLGFGYWAVREKETGSYVGDLGFADFHRVIQPAIKGIPEAGWVIAPEFQGKGYATEAMQAALKWLIEQNKFQESICFIAPDNAPSLRVAQKLGYIIQKEVLMNGACTVLLKKALR